MNRERQHLALIFIIALGGQARAQESFPRGRILYDQPQEYAKLTEQTKLSEARAAEVRARFGAGPNDIEKIARIYQWVKANCTTYEGKGAVVGKQSAEQILQGKQLSGCNDWGVALTCLLRHAGFRSSFLNTAGIQGAKARRNGDLQRLYMGHVFLEVFVADKWIVLDSVTGEYIEDYDHDNPVIPISKRRERETAFFVLQKGRDLWDLGIRDIQVTVDLMAEFARSYPLDTLIIPRRAIKKLNARERGK